jgi:hypothetical protein
MFNGSAAKSKNSSLIGRQKVMNLAGYGGHANQIPKLFIVSNYLLLIGRNIEIVAIPMR